MALLRAPARSIERDADTTARIARDEEKRIQLRDGRWLGYSESGDPNGVPVLFFHGFGTTRVVCPPDGSASHLGVRLIAVDRPGLGLSTPLPGRRLLDWPPDLTEFANALGIEKFSIVGWSGGGPYALACGRVMSDRVTAIALVSGAAPLAKTTRTDYLRRFDRNAVIVAGKAPWVVRLAMWHWGRGQRHDAEAFFQKSLAEMCAADQEVLSEPQLRSRMIANSAELYRQGGRGMYDEALVLARPWGFDPSEIDVPVEIWHGARDEVVPFAMADHLAELIPGAQLRVFPDEGHHLLYRVWPDILRTLVTPAERAAVPSQAILSTGASQA
jgi:pimeloyl-ACP methyl ester carboxylesterase